uniref:FBD domain-containing protein n=1 Tax=Aegilops tauschii subsp. strangulata TaxID=200361 RepID=A0A453KXH1_AEGTS
ALRPHRREPGRRVPPPPRPRPALLRWPRFRQRRGRRAAPEEPHRRGVRRGERHFYHGGAQPSLLPLQRLLHPRPDNPCRLRARRPLPMLRRTCRSPPASRHPTLFRFCLACRGAKKLASGTVLTLCSSALRRVSAKARERSLTKSGAASCELRNLRELQLLMFAMYNSSVDDICVFIVACCPSLLERMFVQLPTNSHYYRAGSEPSESEEELLEENRPVEDLRGEAPPEEDGPEGELPEEEDELQEELPEGELSEEEVELQDELPEGELSEEEDELQDELPEGELSEEEDELQDELPEGEASEENQSEEDWSDEELSDGGQSEEDPVEDCLENLKLLKMTNFKGGDNEMRLLRPPIMGSRILSWMQ